MFIAFQIIHYVIVKSMFPPYRPYTMIWNAISTSILKNFRKTKLLKTYVSGCIDDDDEFADQVSSDDEAENPSTVILRWNGNMHQWNLAYTNEGSSILPFHESSAHLVKP
jgi:hypothetical protein